MTGTSRRPGLDVAGVTVPGLPGIVIGHNQRIAWGMTNLQFDVQDLYIEKFDDRTGRYLFRGQLEQARRESEIIRVKGQRPVELALWVTRHGPIFVTEGNDTPGAALDGRRTGHDAIPRAGHRPRPELAAIHRRAGALFRARVRISCMPMSTATSATMPPARCPCATDTPATFRWTAPRAISNGTALSPSTSFPRSTIRREA